MHFGHFKTILLRGNFIRGIQVFAEWIVLCSLRWKYSNLLRLHWDFFIKRSTRNLWNAWECKHYFPSL